MSLFSGSEDVIWTSLWIVAFAGCILVLWKVLTTEDPKVVQFHAKIHSRSPISDCELVSQYMMADNVTVDVVGRVRKLFAQGTGLPAEKLLPDDRFPHPYYFADLDGDAFVVNLEAEFSVTIPASDLDRMVLTIRCCSKVIQKLLP